MIRISYAFIFSKFVIFRVFDYYCTCNIYVRHFAPYFRSWGFHTWRTKKKQTWPGCISQISLYWWFILVMEEKEYMKQVKSLKKKKVNRNQIFRHFNLFEGKVLNFLVPSSYRKSNKEETEIKILRLHYLLGTNIKTQEPHQKCHQLLQPKEDSRSVYQKQTTGKSPQHHSNNTSVETDLSRPRSCLHL